MKFLEKTVLVISFLMISAAAFGATIKGVVMDAETGDMLPGANIFLKDTYLGDVSNIRGEYLINNVSPGSYTLMVSYIGYQNKSIDIKIEDDNEIQKINFSMDHESILGEAIVITAQAAGQNAAINQQIQSNSIKNIVSAQRIQEIPEPNAAEAVGRLPGVNITPGSGVVVRGLSPHYNKIQIDGVDMASTDFNDRSSSLGMISQYMLAGIEMTKSAMADQEANVLGATVNLIIKEAPEAPKLNFIFQNGYNSLSESYGNQKFVLVGSRRFLDNNFGIFGQVNYERSNTSSNQMDATYNEFVNGFEVINMGLKDVNNKLKNRFGASVVMDYKYNLTKIKMSNFISISDREAITRQERINVTRNTNHQLFIDNTKLSVISSAFQVEQILGPFEMDASASYSYSKNDQPENIDFDFVDRNSFVASDPDWAGDPVDIQPFIEFNPNDAFLGSAVWTERKTEADKLSMDMNFKTNLSLGNWVGLELKFGGLYRHQNKDSDSDKYLAEVNEAYFQAAQAAAVKDLNWLPDNPSSAEGNIGLKYFLDPNYKNSDLLLGDFTLDQMPSIARIREFHNWMANNPNGLEFPVAPYYFDWKASFENDYKGEEDYLGAYIMPTFSFNKSMLTFIPGVRYEKNSTSYTGFRLPAVEIKSRQEAYPEFAEYQETRNRENEFILPMIHLIYRPIEGFDIKASYTHTLSRPKFRDIVPSWSVTGNVVQWNNAQLEPSLSKNIDLHLSAYGNKLGLFTIGVFRKEITDLIFPHGQTQITKEDLDSGFYDGLEGGRDDPRVFTDLEHRAINYEVNNTKPVLVKGLELEWQSNFWFLPGALKGLVFNTNVTFFDSEAKYPQVLREFDLTTFQFIETDTFYVDRLINQPDVLLNVMVGYDYKDFSIRASMKFTDDIFSKNHNSKLFRTSTEGRYDFDISLKQGLPVAGLAAFYNITNIGHSKSVVQINGSDFPTRVQFGGLGMELGFRYSL